MFYSKSTGGFYDPAIHARIPEDAVEITPEAHAALMADQAAGKVIKAGDDGKPVAADPAPLAGPALILSKIAALEASITPRRVREAVLDLDNGWLKDVNDQIATLRATLK